MRVLLIAYTIITIATAYGSNEETDLGQLNRTLQAFEGQILKTAEKVDLELKDRLCHFRIKCPKEPELIDFNTLEQQIVKHATSLSDKIKEVENTRIIIQDWKNYMTEDPECQALSSAKDPSSTKNYTCIVDKIYLFYDQLINHSNLLNQNYENSRARIHQELRNSPDYIKEMAVRDLRPFYNLYVLLLTTMFKLNVVQARIEGEIYNRDYSLEYSKESYRPLGFHCQESNSMEIEE